jgi:hypothetical protein
MLKINLALFMPLTYAQLQEHHLLSPPPAKKLNPKAIGSNYQVPKVPFSDYRQELFLRRQQSQMAQVTIFYIYIYIFDTKRGRKHRVGA